MNFLKTLATALFISVASGSMAQNGFQLKLDVTGTKDNSKVYLLDLDKGKVIDSTVFIAGHATFKGAVREITAMRIHTADKYVVVYLENKNISIKGDFENFQFSRISGSTINDYATKSRDDQRTWEVERDALMNKYFSLDSTNQHLAKGILKRVKTLDSTVFQYRLDFIKKEAPTYFTIKELFFLRNDLQKTELTVLFNKFPEPLRKSKEGTIITLYLNSTNLAVGAKFADIEGIDGANKRHKLSDIKGKYVLLDFWASWCVPCRQENPILVKAYQNYKHKGFEILGFSTDANRENWQEAIKKDQLTWLNISDLLGSYSKGAATYQVRAIPQNFLIDPNGIIIGKNLRGKALEDKLKEIFGGK